MLGVEALVGEHLEQALHPDGEGCGALLRAPHRHLRVSVVELRRTRADAELEPATGELGHRQRGPREHGRVAKRHRADEGPDSGPGGLVGERGQAAPRLEPWLPWLEALVAQVVGDPDRLDPELLEPAPAVNQLRPGRVLECDRAELHPSEAIRSSSSSMKPPASMSTATSAFASQPIRPCRSTLVLPRPSPPSQSTLTPVRTVWTIPGRKE